MSESAAFQLIAEVCDVCLQNRTAALEYFERAAAFEQEADSLFNTGFCYCNGIGTNKSLPMCKLYFEKAASKYGHFSSINELGKMHYSGQVSCSQLCCCCGCIRDADGVCAGCRVASRARSATRIGTCQLSRRSGRGLVTCARQA